MALYSAPRPAGYRALPSGLLTLDSRSPYLLQGDTPPAQPGEQQPFPNTAAALIAALGGGAGVTPLAIYQCDTADPLVDSLGLGPNLVGVLGPLTGRECPGLPGTSFNSKVGFETINSSGGAFRDAAPAAYFDVPDGEVRSFLAVLRFNSNSPFQAVLGKEGGELWVLYNNPAVGRIDLYGKAGYAFAAQVAGDFHGESWHNVVGVIDSVAKILRLRTDQGDGSSAVFAGSISNAVAFGLGGNGGGGTAGVGMAYFAWCAGEITSAQRASFWRAFNLNEFSTPCAYTRAGPLVVPISASRVACYGANQPAVGYNANATAGTNPLRTGVVCEDGISFEPIGSDDFYTRATATGASAKSAADGPSGMRDGVRATMTGAYNMAGSRLYYPPLGVAIVGASNIPWRYDINYRRATVGTTARVSIQFNGDAGGTEYFMIIADNATPVDWVRGGSSATPVGAGHNATYQACGAENNLDDCDFGEPAVVKNRTTAPLAWRRVGTAAAAATGTPALSYTNVGNARYNPARGRAVVRVTGFAGPKFQPALVAGSPFADGVNNPRCACADYLGQIWTTNYDTNTVTVWNAATHAIIGHYATGVGPYYCCADNYGQVWVVNYDASTVTIFNAATHAVIATPATGGSNPEACCADGNGQVWIANTNLNTLSVFNCATRTLVSNFPTGGNPDAICCDGLNQIWVGDAFSNDLNIYNALTRAFIANVPCATAPYDICADLSGQIWVTNLTSNDVKVFNATTRALLATIALGGSPRFPRADAYGYIWIPIPGLNVTRVFNAVTRTLVSTITGVANPVCPCFDALGQIWMTQGGAHAMSVYTPATIPTFLAFGAAGAAGALVLDYAPDIANAPMFPVPPQARLRLWDDVAAPVCDLDLGTMTAAEATRTIEWNAALGTVNVLNGAAVLATKNPPAVWVPEAADVAPLYVGSDPTPANAAHCTVELLDLYNY